MKLSARITLGVVALTVAISIGFVASGALILGHTQSEFLSLTAHSEKSAARSLLQRGNDAFQIHARVIARERDAIGALAAGQFADLREDMVSTFNRIAANGEISDMAIFDAKGGFAVRFPEPGAVDLPEIAREALETGTRVAGATGLSGGRVGYGYAFPLLKGRETVGVALIAKDVATSLQAIAETIDGDAALFVNGTLTGATEGVPESAVMTDGLGEAPEAVAKVSASGRTLVATRTRLLESESLGTADLVLLIDFSAQQATISSETVFYVLLVVGFSVGLLTALLFWLRREFAPLTTMTESLSSLSKGDSVETVSIVSNSEEIVSLGAALEVFVDQAREQQALLADQKRHAREAEERARKAAALQASISDVMSRAAVGDFSARMAPDAMDSSGVEICDHVNRMLDANEHAIDRLNATFDRLAKADLSEDMEGRFDGAFAQLRDSVNRTLARLRDLVGGAQAACGVVRSVAMQITDDAASLASRVEGQSATLEETAATTEVIAGSVQKTAQALGEAQGLADEVGRITQDGAETVENAIDAVRKIEAESDDIQQIVSVIEAIAFQTNLLALNAAVEAARAGDYGRGFAVVASEVRTLAQRASDAAKDIAGKISSSGASVSKGVRLAESAGQALADIQSKIDDLVTRIQTSATAGRDQASSAMEMSSAVSHLDSLAQENSAASERNAASARNLADEIGKLDKLIGAFRVPSSARALSAA